MFSGQVIFYLILIGLIIIAYIAMGLTIHFQRKKIRNQKIKIDGLEESIAQKEKNLQLLKDFQEAIIKIEKVDSEMNKKIKEVKTKDEAITIMHDIINSINSV